MNRVVYTFMELNILTVGETANKNECEPLT